MNCLRHKTNILIYRHHKRKYLLGRGNTNDIIIDKNLLTISRRHCTISVHKSGRCYVKDYSCNGCYLVNLQKKCKLQRNQWYEIKNKDRLFTANVLLLEWMYDSTVLVPRKLSF
mgnify:CR=1 FL=1